LGDLRVWHAVRASCPRCRHDPEAGLDALFRGRSLHLHLKVVEQAPCCAMCGNRAGNFL
jgi:hypothetical protein